MQALGSYEGGRMLFLGLGTGLGSTMIVDGILEPMELGHLPFRKATYEDYVGLRGLQRLGKKNWRKAVDETIATLVAALEPEYVILGGGNVRLLHELPENVRLGHNEDAFLGGFRLWRDPGLAEPSGLDPWAVPAAVAGDERVRPPPGPRCPARTAAPAAARRAAAA